MRKIWMGAVPVGVCALVLLTSCSSTNLNSPGTNRPSASGPSLLYVASGAEPVTAQPNITGYRIAPNGRLTWLPCAPIANSTLLDLVGSGHLLFTTDGSAITAYAVDSNGCITPRSTTDEELNPNLNGCYSNCYAEGPDALFLDPKGQNLYSWNIKYKAVSEFVSYDFDPGGRSITLTGTGARAGYPAQPVAKLAFSADGNYAVSAGYPPYLPPTGIVVYQRLADGTLKLWRTAAPVGLETGRTFDPDGAAADSSRHFIVAGRVECANDPSCSTRGSWQLAVYTMDSSGNMTTQSTAQNMQTPPSLGADREWIGYAFSPDSRYFAIGSNAAIDVYSWNTSSAALSYIASIPSPQPCTGIGPCPSFHFFVWDHYDHIIATWGKSIDPDAQIQVYSIVGSGIAEAPGSPYPLPSANMLTVLDGD